MALQKRRPQKSLTLALLQPTLVPQLMLETQRLPMLALQQSTRRLPDLRQRTLLKC